MLDIAVFLCSDGAPEQHVLVTQQKGWFEAQSYCRQHYTDLVSVRSAAENQALRHKLQHGHTVEAWIGLHRVSYRWSDHSSSSFRSWGKNEPNNQPNNGNNTQMCVAMHHEIWMDWSCEAPFGFLCQSKKQNDAYCQTFKW